MLELVRHEVATQLDRIDGKSLEAIANQVAEILKKSAAAGRTATRDATTQASKTAKGASTQAGKTAKGATQAKTAKGVSTRPARRPRASPPRRQDRQARHAAAKKVTPSRGGAGKSGSKKSEAKSQGRTRSPRTRSPRARSRTRRPPAERRGPPSARCRARATWPRPEPARGPGGHRRRHGARGGNGRGQGGAAGGARRARRPARSARRPSWAAAARSSTRPWSAFPSPSPGGGPSMPGRRPAASPTVSSSAAPRTCTRSTWATASSTPPPRRRPGHGPGAHQCPDADRRGARGRRPGLRAVPAGRDRPLLHLAPQRDPGADRPGRPRPVPTSSSWSSRSSRQAGPPSPGARAWCGTLRSGSGRSKEWRPRSMTPEPASWGRWPPR